MSHCATIDDWIGVPAMDRALSAEARLSRRFAWGAETPPESVFLQGSKERARQSLFDAYRAAASKNWDGEGAAAADLSSFEYASALIDRLYPDLPTPDIYADPDGEFCLEWDYGPRSVFSVSVGRDGTLAYAGLFDSSKVHGIEVLLDALPPAIRHGIERATNR